jgi:hypothetical protein
MAVLSIFVFGATLAVSIYAIWATVRPELARIADLLANGPVAQPTSAGPVPARGNPRSVSVRAVTMAPRSLQRAVA